jgi:hypothetical protein
LVAVQRDLEHAVADARVAEIVVVVCRDRACDGNRTRRRRAEAELGFALKELAAVEGRRSRGSPKRFLCQGKRRICLRSRGMAIAGSIPSGADPAIDGGDDRPCAPCDRVLAAEERLPWGRRGRAAHEET